MIFITRLLSLAGTLYMKSQFATVGIFGRVKTPAIAQTLMALVDYLQTLNQPFIIESETAEAITHTDITKVAREHLAQQCELLIVVGGDGSFLHASRAVMDSEIPLVGINRGKLGFLTDILPSELTHLRDILNGKYTLEKRFLLTAVVTHHEKKLSQEFALNEVAILPSITCTLRWRPNFTSTA
jgi:NAD+ kinase